MGHFGLAIVAVDVYEHHDDLPSSKTAERIRRLLEPCGVESVRQPAGTDEATDLLGFLDDWANDREGPGATLLYWVGHGSREGQQAWLLAGRSKSPLTPIRAVDARTVADMLRTRWTERTAGDGSWTVLVLDCCRGRDAATAIVNALTTDLGSRPEELAVVEVGGNAATEVGRFADALEEALAGFTENDTVIPLRSVLYAATDRLSVNTQPTLWLSCKAAIDNPRVAPAVLTVTQDYVEELRAVVATLDQPVRDHFLAKAQGSELGWHFVGRRGESAQLAAWLRDTPSGMFVVTGEPGAGKSALLGRFVALADPTVAGVLDRAGLVADDPAARPEPGTFDGVVHLTGKTLYDTRTAIERAVPGVTIGDAGVSLEEVDHPITILVDALDEAQAPQRIAYDVLRPLARHPNVRVVVGTRRSLAEGPDLPAAPRAELLDALGVSEDDALILHREPAAMADYARRRLAADAPHLDDALVAHVVERIETVDQPFLFVRLAMYELLARADELDRDTVDTILSGSHGDVFAIAIDRLTRRSPTTAQLLRALAYAQGRGLPRHDRVWATVAQALFPDGLFGESHIAQALADAAPYIVLDGEHGQSVHRLAHKTYAERFLTDDPDLAASHAAITDQLRASVADTGWSDATPYLLAHLPRHAASSPPRLDRICGDPGWLAGTIHRFGIDDLLSILEAAFVVARTPAQTRIKGAVRRARVALARDPDQLAAQLYARLRDEDDPVVRTLIEGLTSIAPPIWLRVTEGGGNWTASSNATMTFPAKVRAITAGRLRGRSVILVGAGDTVSWWDPARGTIEQLLDTNGERVTALALGTVDGRDVVAVGAGYNGTITVYPIDGGAPLLRRGIGGGPLAVGMLSGTPVVVVSYHDGVRIYPFGGGEMTPILVDADVLALGFEGGTLVMLLTDPDGPRLRRTNDGQDALLTGVVRGVAHALIELDGGMVAVVAQSHAVEAWHVELGHHLADPPTVRQVGRVETGREFTVRTATALIVDDNLKFAAGSDTDYEGGYVQIQSPGEERTVGSAHPLLKQALAVSSSPSLAVAADGDQMVLFDPRRDGPSSAVTTPADPAELADVFGPAAPIISPDSARPRLGPAGPTDQLNPPSRLRVDQPGGWPVNTRAFGRLDDQPVVATAHLDGVCWLWSVETGEVVAGPFGAVHAEISLPPGPGKGGPQPSTDIAYRHVATDAVLARVHKGEVVAWNVPTGTRLAIADIRGSEATAVALGVIDDQLVLARGASGGAISVWSVKEVRRLCGLTLDSGIRRLWFDHAKPTLMALTADGTLHVADVVT